MIVSVAVLRVFINKWNRKIRVYRNNYGWIQFYRNSINIKINHCFLDLLTNDILSKLFSKQHENRKIPQQQW